MYRQADFDKYSSHHVELSRPVRANYPQTAPMGCLQTMLGLASTSHATLGIRQLWDLCRVFNIVGLPFLPAAQKVPSRKAICKPSVSFRKRFIAVSTTVIDNSSGSMKSRAFSDLSWPHVDNPCATGQSQSSPAMRIAMSVDNSVGMYVHTANETCISTYRHVYTNAPGRDRSTYVPTYIRA